MSKTVFKILRPKDIERFLPQLAALHHKTVHHGANLSVVLPFPLAEANALWKGLLPGLLAGKETVFVACDSEESLIGCAMLIPDDRASFPQRAEVEKLAVDLKYRRR